MKFLIRVRVVLGHYVDRENESDTREGRGRKKIWFLEKLSLSNKPYLDQSNSTSFDFIYSLTCHAALCDYNQGILLKKTKPDHLVLVRLLKNEFCFLDICGPTYVDITVCEPMTYFYLS